MSLEQITTHADDAAARLSGQWASSPLLQGLLKAIGDCVQDDEDCLATLRAWYRSIAAAQGTTLDAIGTILDQARYGGDFPAGESDAAYRLKLTAAIARNNSCGEAETIYTLVEGLLGAKLVGATLIESYPAGFLLFLAVTVALTAAEQASVADFVVRAKALGVGIGAIAYYTDPVFGFFEDPDPFVEGFDVGGFADAFYP